MEKDEQKRVVAAARRAGYTVIAIMNEGKRGVAVTRDLRAMGVLSGVSDLFFPHTVRESGYKQYKGIWLEMKDAQRTRPFPISTCPCITGGKCRQAKGICPSRRENNQADWGALMQAAGYLFFCEFGAVKALARLKPYLPKLKPG